MVEFALCAPIVFAILFGVINGGLFMYAKSAVARAANVGSVTLAAAGVDPNADQATLTAMQKAGVGANSLVNVQWVKVEKVNYSSSLGYQTDMTGCKDSFGNPNQPCVNQYQIDGTPMWTYGGAACTADPYHCPPWPPSARSVHAGGANPASFVRLTIHYTFVFPATGKSFTFDEAQVFRLEPKDL
ncbi:MAG TPA: TadE/TadG family type IV pilus assembly protein [Candidatus Dormibacteraeota bacterium]